MTLGSWLYSALHQTAQMSRLICAFAGPTCNLAGNAGNALTQLIYPVHSKDSFHYVLVQNTSCGYEQVPLWKNSNYRIYPRYWDTLLLILLGPVVQSVVSLTSSLRVISLTVLADSIHNILIFFAEKM